MIITQNIIPIHTLIYYNYFMYIYTTNIKILVYYLQNFLLIILNLFRECSENFL